MSLTRHMTYGGVGALLLGLLLSPYLNVHWLAMAASLCFAGATYWVATGLHNALVGASGARRVPKAEKPLWIVNREGELGVYVNDEAHFLYKGRSLQYRRSPTTYRQVYKCEFGECQRSSAQIAAGQESGGDFLYAEADENEAGYWVSEGPPPEVPWYPDIVGG